MDLDMNSSNDNDNDNDNDLEMDTSWIDQQEKIQTIDATYYREPMESIDIYILYINQNKFIENIIYEKHPLVHDKTGSFLSKEFLIQFIQSKKKSTPFSKYKFETILYYNIDLEPENIQSYSLNTNFHDVSDRFFKVLPIINDIYFSDSIFIFHGVNSLFFLFQEVEHIDNSRRHTLKSILKTDKTIKNVDKKHMTKKVNIHLASDSLYKNKTYKNKNGL
jgi:hypothetical protein